MMRAILIAIFAWIATAPADAAERRFSIFGFEEIRVTGAIDVDIVTGKSLSASAEGPTRELLDRIALSSSGKALTVSVIPKATNGRSSDAAETVRLRLTTAQLVSVTQMGSGTIMVSKLGGRTPRILQGGFGTIAVGDLTADRLIVTMNGGGQVSLAGKAADALFDITGAGTLDAGALDLKQAKLVQRGSGKSLLSVANMVTIDNNGNGQIVVQGRPSCTIKSLGSAEIICSP